MRIIVDGQEKLWNGQTVYTSAARAIISIQHLVLVARGVGENFTHMPGGHIDPGETPDQGLLRELHEEMGRMIQSFYLVAETDHSFVRSWDGTREVQHSYIFKVQLLPVLNEIAEQSREPNLRYEWHPAHELTRANLQPPLMISIIHQHI